ncbi:unnamed protein product [Leuciscus chuanchicus]
MDLHKKGVFSMPVSDIEDPPPQFEGHVDIEEFWQSVDQEIVCRGFLQSNRENPCKVSPSYVKWAPWIGPLTRASKKVLNTEYAKLTAKKSVVEQADIDISEERLSSELTNLKVDALRKLVKECGVDSKGSKMDLLLRLREEMKTRSTYDKVFQKVWGASGGWAVIMCPCGIVNSVKFNIRAESPRDYADMLLSFKHFPNVVIYDFARGLVTHTNFREPERLPFSPFEGRVAAATPENIASAKRGELKINLSWLQIKKDPPDLNGHPATGSAEHYALYDTFHQYNTKDEKDALRLIGLVPELCGWVNSQIVEQLFSGMRKNNYFMNSLSPASHIFLMRNILHHHNEKVNQQALEDLKRVSHGDVTLDAHGKATLVHVNIPKDVDMADHCGEQCEALTMTSNLMPCRASWTLGVHHPLQEQLVNYVLDEDRPMNELIVKDGQTCLTRENFVSLGLRREMDSMVGNACFRLIKEIFQHQGKDVYIVDLHIPPTWLLPSSCDPFLCLPHDMPCLRRWWCTMLVENLEIEGQVNFFYFIFLLITTAMAGGLPTLPSREYRWPGEVWTQFSASLGRGNMMRLPCNHLSCALHVIILNASHYLVLKEPVPLKPCKVKEPCRVESSPEGIGILQLPEEVLHKIFILVVLQDGDPAILTLALTCTHFWKIVREESFLKEAHFCWLDSVVNWNSFSEEYKRTYRIPYLISRCIQCDDLYKDCEGYWGSGQRGKLQGFYSENDFAGYCCMDCFYVAGGTI